MYKIIQVYYDDSSLRNCYRHGSITRFYNPQHTDFFENSIISLLSEEALKYDQFAVWSHAHRFKLQGGALKFDRLEEMIDKFDLVAFQRMLRNGRIFSGDNEKKYGEIFNRVMKELGLKYRFPQRPKFIVMQNHFICRGEIFSDYVKSVLVPAMLVIDSIPEAAEQIEYRGKAGRYTFKPFLCEKLMSAYLEEKKYKCQHW